MKKLRISALIIALFAGLTLLVACEKKEAPPAPAPQAEAPAPIHEHEAQPATDAAATEPSDAAPASEEAPASEDATETPQPAAALPTDCESYLVKIQECVNKLHGTAAAEALSQQMEQARASWSQATDQEALGTACKQASEAFAQSASGMGC